jgi:hypothetical protein
MRDYRDAKAMARSLRQALGARGVAVTHGDSLELIARSFGFDNWNVLAARIGDGGPAVEKAAFDLASAPMTKAALSRLSDEQFAEFCALWRDVMWDRRSVRPDRATPANQP